MSTCCWCTPGGISTIDFLQRYASETHSSEFRTADEDLCYCLECVAEYHKARDELPFLHKVLWELETSRLINHFEKAMKAEIGDDDELYIIDSNGEAQLFDFTGQDFENKLRVPLLEILKYPYLLLHERVNELCVEALCRMEQANCSFQVFDKHPGIYLFLVHPNEMVRRWAILTARNLGKVDRDDYYDLQEVLTCLFKVIELGLLESPDIYTSSVLEKGKLILLPSHMYDTANYKNYWLGICMLLTILEEQAMDSLLLGSNKQNDFMQSILHTMERQSDDDSVDPFWPALHCFMVILDRLGSKVWGQLIDPIEAFQTIINNVSYNKEIQNIRNSSVRSKLEAQSYLDDTVTCSQIVYNYNPEKTKKVAQEWTSSPNKEKFHQLHLRKFPAEYKKYWEFVVYLDECELAKQLHPKENDLVFLVPERLNGEKKDIERHRMQDPHEYYCGYVHKFRRTSVMRNGKSECSLSIQTQHNLPVNLNEFVKCLVISSLVTTQRKLKAMSLLSGRSQLARAVLNPNPMDFCTKDLLTTASERIIAYLKDFNEDQKKAIETAYAMVKHSPAVAKICLIHGPPGTGKSKTIVGLLYRLLTERRGHSDENSNAKIKQNRVLVCAPSNAAVDELMKKIILEFKEKCKDKKNPLGNCGDINLVRLGPEKSINTEVLKFSLDSQVNHRMKKDLPSHIQEMHRRKEFLDHQLDELSRQRALCRGGRELQRQKLDEKIAKVSKERQELASKIKEVQGRPQKTQNIIILESHIICCTLSTSGGLLLEAAFRGQGGVPFSCVIVDEAGQSCEVETLTPLIHRCSKLILVGDPKQLPPTVISVKAQDYGYDQSMMARFYKLLEENVEHNVIGRLPVLQLTIQYRMHPDICLFPSNYVYNRSLKTNRLTETIRCSSEWPFQPYLVFDVGDGSEKRDNDSYVNVQEIKLVMEIIKLIKDKRKDVTFRNIGIITHYKAQKMMIQKDLDKEFDGKGPAEVDTVDAFQGRQKDCVIVTCVRANAMQGSIGFLASLQRLNVTITRAKYSLFILGHLRTLMENQHWNHLIQDAQKRGAIIKTWGKNYRRDAVKILKLKPVLQRGLAHPPAVTPEASTPQGGVPSNQLDSAFAKMSFASSPYPSPSDSKEATVTVTAKDPERPPIQDRLRDPRLLRRMGLGCEAKGKCLSELQPSSPQYPGATPPLGEPGFPGSHQDPTSIGQQPPAKGAAVNNHRPHAQCDAPAASTNASTSKRAQEGGALSHRRETRAFTEGDQERRGSLSHHTKRNSGWDERGLEEEDSSLKKRRLL
ncbi:probable helicase senataxin isoform X4 [Balaenoptera acutorostrata]|uniref:Probable helicase senataxin isoform X4 n=1 Tax=Balaenoptera acutorostrata TaxID=9767 RepID=A0ABM3TP39_BALAC|nr:probable helicase senataxin isoform X4 [Balaenoptera acutorostrata]